MSQEDLERLKALKKLQRNDLYEQFKEGKIKGKRLQTMRVIDTIIDMLSTLSPDGGVLEPRDLLLILQSLSVIYAAAPLANPNGIPTKIAARAERLEKLFTAQFDRTIKFKDLEIRERDVALREAENLRKQAEHEDYMSMSPTKRERANKKRNK